MSTEVNWEPVRRGDRYCSSACGGGCTWSAYKRAHANAKALAKRLGKGWKAHVWENLGWHWEAVNGVLRVSRDRYSGKERYNCMFAPHYTWFGRRKYAATPEKAIADTVRMVACEIDKIVRIRDCAMKIAKEVSND